MKYKRMQGFILLILFCILITAFNDRAIAGEPLISSLSLDTYSNYIWRGQKYSSGVVLQPGIDLNDGQYGLNVLGNYDINKTSLDELIFTLDYMKKIDGGYFDFGLIYYNFPAHYFPSHNHNDTAEAYLTTSIKFIIDILITFYYDFEMGTGAFLISEYSYSLPIGKYANLKLGAEFNMDMSNSLMGRGRKGQYFFNFYNGELIASFVIKAADNFVLEPLVAYSYPLSADANLNIKDELFYGLRAKLAL